MPLAVTIQNNSLRSFGTVGIAADDFGLKAIITWNTLSSAAPGVNARDSDRRGYRVSDQQLD